MPINTGIPLGGNMAAAQYMMGMGAGYPQQQPQQQSADPNDILAQSLSLGYKPPAHGPVYSPAAGAANVVSDIAGGYFARKRFEQLLNYEAQAGQAGEAALEKAADTSQGAVSGVPANIANGQATTQTPQQGQPTPDAQNAAATPDPNASAAQRYAQVSLPVGGSAGGASPADVRMNTPAQNANLAAAQLAHSGPLGGLQAQQMRPQLMQAALAAQPPKTNWTPLNTASGTQVAVGTNELTGQPTGQTLNPLEGNAAGAGGALGAKPTTQSDNADQLGLTGEARRAYIARVSQEGLPESWRPSTPAEKASVGLAAITPAQTSTKTGEVKSLAANNPTITNAYDATDGTPLGPMDFSDPGVKAKLSNGEILPEKPTQLPPADAQTLQGKGTMLQQLKEQLSAWKPTYGHTLAAGSSVRGALGYDEAANWVNRTNGILLSTVKDTVGRSPQLIEEFNKNRPEGTDTADVQREKLENLIKLQGEDTSNLAGTYLKGGYLGRQVIQAAGFDPRGLAQGAPTPASIAHLQANPGLASQFDEAYGPGASKRFVKPPIAPAAMPPPQGAPQ